MKRLSVIPVLFVLAAPAVAADASSAAPRTARVAGGQVVALQASARSGEAWSAVRPGWPGLRPKARGTFD